jgi:hypothetical protein
MVWHLTTALLLGNSIGCVNSAFNRNVRSSNIALSMALHSNGNPAFRLADSSSEVSHHSYRHYSHHTPLNSLPPTTTHASTNHPGLYLQLTEQQVASVINAQLCLGLSDIFIALFLVCYNFFRKNLSNLDSSDLAHYIR